jgi:pimeloyl-ACP methyl ester carboxylesterase
VRVRFAARMPPSPAPLRFQTVGAGAPVVLLHGVGGHRLLWASVLAPLGDQFRLLVPELRGHGETPSPPGSTFGVDEAVTDLLALLDEQGLDRVHWVGFSGSGFVAIRLALDHPERVRSLTLVSAAAYLDAHARSVIERWWSVYAKEGPDAFALRLLKDVYYPDWIEAHLEVADALREEVLHRDYRAAVAWSRALTGFDERNGIATLRTPTLIFQAMDDQVIDASHGRILRQSIPGSQIRILAQTGHMIPIERPTEFAESARAFWQAADNAAGSK